MVNTYYPIAANIFFVTLSCWEKRLLHDAEYISSYIFESKINELYLVLLPIWINNIHKRVVIPYNEKLRCMFDDMGKFNLRLEIADLFIEWSKVQKSQLPTIWNIVILDVYDGNNVIFSSDSLKVHRYYSWTWDEDDTRVCARDIWTKIYTSLGDDLFLK